MDPTTSKIAELEEYARQLTLDIAKKKEVLNQVKTELSVLLLKASKDGRVTKAKPEDPQNDGSLSPYGVFPELVWLQISSNIQDSHDWLNLYFASSKLMDLLQNEMVERMFPQIFSHLLKYLKMKDVLKLCAAERKFESAIISWVQARWLAPSWAVEGYYDEHDGNYFAKTNPPFTSEIYVDDSKQIQRITNELLEGGSGFLIPFGIIFCEPLRDREVDQFWDSVKTFLQSFGTRIWFCKFISYTKERDRTPFLDMIIEYLKLMPNVIRLGLIIPFTLMNPMAHPPKFPHLAKLKVLSLFHETPKDFMDLLRPHSDQLEYLSIEGKQGLEESLRCSNLKMLRMQSNIPFQIPRFPLRLDLISQAPLTKIFTEVTAFGFAEFGRKFLQFNNFGESLEDLELQVEVEVSDCYDREENDMTWAVNINLPKLKKLTIWSDGTGLHLLLRMHSFQDSHFPFPMDWLLSSKKNKNIFDSNIWSIVSSLEEVKFCNWNQGTTGFYTRQQYNQYHEDPLNFNF